MGNIVGEGFNKKIIEQIKQRQKVYGSLNRDNEQLTYLNSKTGWCKLISGASINSEVLDVRKLKGLSFGDDLAKNYVLFGGMRGGPNTSRQGIAQTNEIGSPNAYGFGGTEFGLRPMPGIISAEIQTETRGSIKKATVRIQANNKDQFDVIDLLYMRLGYSMLLEWGSSSYFKNDGTYEKNNPYSLETEFLNGYYNTVNDTTEDLTYNNILSVIEQFRLKSHGNYDALFCKVVNFSWSFTKDGKYDITLNLISLGDVIESLKANVLYKGSANTTSFPNINTATTSSSASGSQPSPIVTFQNAHEIGKKFYEIYTALEPYSGGYTGMAYAGFVSDTTNTGYTSGQSLPYYKQVFKDTEPIYYIRLGYFLEWINANILYNINNNPNQKILKIDTNVKTNIIYLVKNQLSSNLKICVFKTVYKYPYAYYPQTYFAYPYGDTFEHYYSAQPDEFNKYGYLMNAYFSLEYILNEIENKKDKNGKTSMYDLLTSLCDGFNQATGNFTKLEVTIDPETNIIRFIDSVELPSRDIILNQLNDPEISTEEALFDTYRYVDAEVNNETVSSAGFIRDLSFTTTVSPELATMITVGATSQGYVVGEDATALSRMNLGITDRYKETINEPNQNTTVNSGETIEDKYNTALIDFSRYVAYIGYTQYGPSTAYKPKMLNAADLGNMSQTQTQLYEYQQAYETYIAAQFNDTAASANAGFLPFNLSLTMDGLSGMKVYQKFTIESDFLPSNYPRTLEFLIKSIKNKIESNQWVTVIESMCIAKDPFGTLSQTSSTSSLRRTLSAASTPTRTTTTTGQANVTANNIITPTNIPPPASNTPLLTKAVTDQSQYVFNSRGEALGLCANYTFNIAYKVKEHIDTRSNQAIPFSGGIGRGTANIPSGGNANTNSHRQAINRLGLYDEYYIGEYTPSQLKQWASSQTFNYGDILNYYAPGQSGPHNMHSQIYTGTLFRSGKSRSGTAGNSGWTTSVKTNYGGTVIYNNNYPFKVYYYQVKPTYQV
jgi:hypothetical protein